MDLRFHGLLPMLPSKRWDPFDSPDWIFELKWGGVRALAFVDGGRVALRGENGGDLTPAYPELELVPAQLDARSAVLDGEVVTLGPQGRPAPELLRPRLNLLLERPAEGDAVPAWSGGSSLPHTRSSSPLAYEVTDLLALDGELLLDRPLWQRKNLLHGRLRPTPECQVSDFVEGEGTAFFEAVCDLRLEGMVAKNRYRPYVPGKRMRHWLEVPALGVGQFVIGGYTFGGGQKKAPFDALLLGAFHQGRLVYAGRATASLSNPEGWRTVGLLERLHTRECPFADAPAVNRFSYWCRPELVCQVRVGERGPRGDLRFALFTSLRPDLPPQGCLWEG